MEERPKNVRGHDGRGKGFYIAMYASLGGLLLLALALGYYSFLGPPAATADGYVAEVGNLFDASHAELEHLPVGSQWEMPVTVRPSVPQAPTITTPAPTPVPQEQPNGNETGARPPADAEPAPPPQTEPAAPQGGDDEAHAEEDAIYNVFEPAAPSFTYFAQGDTMHWPVLGDVVMDFAVDRLVFDPTLDQWRTNDNMAIAASRGDSVRASADGRVYNVAQTREFGQIVVIDHGNGWLTTYSQLDPDVAVRIGDVVNRGQIIGQVGSPSIFASRMGYHVGFRVTNEGSAIDPGTLLTAAQ